MCREPRPSMSTTGSVSGAQPDRTHSRSTIDKALAGAATCAHAHAAACGGKSFYDSDPARPGLTYDGSPELGDSNAPIVMLAFHRL